MKHSTTEIVKLVPVLSDILNGSEASEPEVIALNSLNQTERTFLKLVIFFESPNENDFNVRELFETLSGEWLSLALKSLNTFFEKDTFLLPKETHSFTTQCDETSIITHFKEYSHYYLNQKQFVDLLNEYGLNYTEAKFSVYIKRGKVPESDIELSGSRYWLKTTCENHAKELKGGI